MGQLSILPAFFLKETICQAKADKVPQPEPFGDPTTVMLRHIPNRSDRPQQSPGVSEIFAPSIKRKPRSQVILRWEGFLNRYKSNTSIYNKLRNCNTKGWKRYPFLYLSSTSWSRRYTSAQLVELLDAKGFKAMQSASACLVTWWPLLVSVAAVWAIEATGIGWLLDVDGCCSFMAGQIRLRVPTNRFPEQGQPRVSQAMLVLLSCRDTCFAQIDIASLVSCSNFIVNQVLLCKSSFPWMGSPIQTGPRKRDCNTFYWFLLFEWPQ